MRRPAIDSQPALLPSISVPWRDAAWARSEGWVGVCTATSAPCDAGSHATWSSGGDRSSGRPASRRSTRLRRASWDGSGSSPPVESACTARPESAGASTCTRRPSSARCGRQPTPPASRSQPRRASSGTGSPRTTLEDGEPAPAKAGDIRTIQTLLGYRDVRTTTIYTHALNCGPGGVRSPADRLLLSDR